MIVCPGCGYTIEECNKSINDTRMNEVVEGKVEGDLRLQRLQMFAEGMGGVRDEREI